MKITKPSIKHLWAAPIGSRVEIWEAKGYEPYSWIKVDSRTWKSAGRFDKASDALCLTRYWKTILTTPENN